MTPKSELEVSPLTTEDLKLQWRARIRRARQVRSERKIADYAEQLKDLITALPEVANAACVSVYASRRFEPHTLPLMESLRAADKQILVPMLGDGLQRGWGYFIDSADLQERAPGRPPEPSTPFLGAAALAEAEAVIVPALACDTQGNRLGQGGGWYDRALKSARPGAPIIALVFDDELFDASQSTVPHEPHDLPVDAVITPKRVHWVNRD